MTFSRVWVDLQTAALWESDSDTWHLIEDACRIGRDEHVAGEMEKGCFMDSDVRL